QLVLAETIDRLIEAFVVLVVVEEPAAVAVHEHAVRVVLMTWREAHDRALVPFLAPGRGVETAVSVEGGHDDVAEGVVALWDSRVGVAPKPQDHARQSHLILLPKGESVIR